MYRFLFLILCFSTSSVLSDEETGPVNIASRATLINPLGYYQDAIQHLIYRLEERGWSSLKALNYTQAINEITHTNLVVAGQVNYTNGFLISLQSIDISNMQSAFNNRVVDGATVTTANVRGRVSFRTIRIGYDVNVKLNNEENTRRYTGVFPHTLLETEFIISKNFNTNEMNVISTLRSLSGGSGVRMQFMPEDEISQVISLTFVASSNFPTAEAWVSIMADMLLDIVTNTLEFPEVLFQ